MTEDRWLIGEEGRKEMAKYTTEELAEISNNQTIHTEKRILALLAYYDRTGETPKKKREVMQ